MAAARLDLGELGRAVVRLEGAAVRVYDATGRPAPVALELAALAVLARRALTGGDDPLSGLSARLTAH